MSLAIGQRRIVNIPGLKFKDYNVTILSGPYEANVAGYKEPEQMRTYYKCTGAGIHGALSFWESELKEIT